MKITCQRLADPPVVLPRLLAATTGKEEKPLTQRTWQKLLVSEHSPIRVVTYLVEMMGTPYYASVHLVRHKHGVEHFVKSQRPATNRADLPQGALVNHIMHINAQALINMGRRRLCHKADVTAQAIVTQIKLTLRKGDQWDEALSTCMQPTCVWYGGHCPEFKCCNQRKTKGYIMDMFFRSEK